MSYVGLNPQQQLLNTSTETFSGNAVAYQFILNRAVASASDLDVMIGQTLQRPFADYEAEDTSLLFQSPPASGTNNITVTYRAGALNSLNLTANAFGAGTVGAPSVYSVAANNSGLYFANATSVVTTVGGVARLVVSGNANSTSNTTGAVQVIGGIGATGNINTSGRVIITDNTQSTSVSTGALLVTGGIATAGNMQVGGSITCVGNFTVNGTFTTTGTDSLDVTDPFIFLANANPGDTYDSGVVTQYYDGTNTRYTGYFRDITDNKFKLFGNLLPKPGTTVDTSNVSFQYQDLILANLSATGNVSGTYVLGNGALLTGIITSVSNVVNGTSGLYVPALNGNVIINVGGATISTVSSSVGLAITGNVNATTGMSAAGNIVGGNVISAGIASATGNITSAGNVSGGNLLTGGQVSAAGAITGGAGASITGNVSASGNVTGGNVFTAGFVTATGNVTGGNIKTAGLLSAAGAVYGDSFSSAQGVNAGAGISAGTDITAGNDISATGAVNAGGTMSAIGNITGNFFLGNGRALTGIDSTGISSGTSNVKIVAANANATINIANVSNVVVFSSTGQTTTGFVSATGNVIAGNVTTAGQISATSNITGGNLSVTNISGSLTTVAQGNITSVGTLTSLNSSGAISATGNVTGGNLITGAAVSAGGAVSATGNVTGGNLITNGLINAGGAISATGNITGGNINTAGLVSSTGNITNGIANVLTGNAIVTSLVQAATLSATGNIIGGNLNAAGLSLSGNVVSGLSMVTNITTTANITGGNILYGSGIISGTGNIVTTGNVVTDQLVVTGSVSNPSWTTTGIAIRSVASTYTDSSTLASGTATSNHVHVLAQPTIAGANVSQVTTAAATLYIAAAPAAGTNMTITNPYALYVAAGNVTVVANVAGGNLLTAGLISATGNVTGGNINGGANVNATLHSGTTVSVTGTITGASVVGGVMTGTSISVTGAVTGAGITGTSLTVTTGSVTAGNIINGNANGVGNIGSSTVYYNTGFLKATTAQYADLAENYSADADYAPGTVLVFGGNNEVTISSADADARVAGVVSTDPAHLMNSTLDAEHVTAVALTGRVPTRVVGSVRKGDMMVTADNGSARACATPAMGTVIGKALQDFDGDSGTIEIVVGRL
jgi:filamentous hemagglutinin